VGYLFFNGPVQNGDFTFVMRPGKAVGIQIAEALNHILGAPPVPHMWNTVTLSGDLRYRQRFAADQELVSRKDFEASIIAAKYGTGPQPQAGTATDADDALADLAMTMIASRISAGTLKISRETVRICARCGHMTGTGHHPCKACGHTISRTDTARHLITNRHPGQPALDVTHTYACKRRPPRHLRNIAGNTPPRLILSRTRDHGIDLGPLGLPGLVLDPRVGVHIAILAAALQRRATIAVMATTQNAAANIAAYGQHFTDHDGLRLLYALHGYVPYHQMASLRDTYAAYGISITARAAFETWFLPLFSLREKNGVRADQLPALLKYFNRACLARPAQPDEDIMQGLRQSVRKGDTDWVMRKPVLAAAWRLREDCRHGSTTARA
jgi:hypothetical protein